MAVVFLNSLDDRRLAPYRDLANRDAANRDVKGEHAGDDDQRFVVEGRFLVERLLASPFATESILTDATRVATLPAGIDAQTTVLVLPADTIDQLIGFEFHRGMLACGLRPARRTVNELVPAPPSSSLMVICSQVVDPANLGGIMRNCAAFGAAAILLGPGCADPFSRRALRVSMGAVLNLSIGVSRQFEEDLRWLADQHDMTLVATVLDESAERLSHIERLPRVGIVIGNEGFGLSDETIKVCQRRVTIPIRSGVDSLNVAVASGLFLYHFSART